MYYFNIEYSAFALGLGPVPFMLTAELVPYYVSSLFYSAVRRHL